MKRKFTTNSRIVNDLFANYTDTFVAFCELINNSIQAKAKNIWIDIEYVDVADVNPLIVKKIIIKDDGCGIHNDELECKILNIGTANKNGGKGIGRFAAFQIGQTIKIETIGYSNKDKKFSSAVIPLQVGSFCGDVNEVNINTTEEILQGEHETYYKVTIMDLYDPAMEDTKRKSKIAHKLLKENINNSLFERYPIKIFNEEIKIHINGKMLLPSDFIVGKPIEMVQEYIDKKGTEHKVHFNFIRVNTLDKIKIFLTILNSGIQTIATGFEYRAEWLSPKIGGWFVYIQCDTIDSDMYRNIDLDSMDEDVRHYKSFIKDKLTDFFKAENKGFDDFTKRLQEDKYYPYREKSSSKSKVMVFDKLAFLIEEEYNILDEKNKLREIIYPLIDRVISNGELDQVLNNILKLNNGMISQFSALLERAELSNIIEFTDKVSIKLRDIDCLEKLVCSEISKHVKERKELHKFLENKLWIFDEKYNGSTKLLSDKNLEKNLKTLRDDCLTYKASAQDNNIISVDKSIKSITDLFMYSEKIIDAKKREVLVVELKAPRVKIGTKELGQVMKYATEIAKSPITPTNVKFKILLVSSEINEDAAFAITGKDDNPYIYFTSKNVEIWVIKWADILEITKRKLKYMSTILEIKDVDIQQMIGLEFEKIGHEKKTSSTLKKT